eukprot:1151709-Pelagomonas_calceolata.AAC.1
MHWCICVCSAGAVVAVRSGHATTTLLRTCAYYAIRHLMHLCMRVSVSAQLLVPLSLSMVGMMAANPVAISRVLLQVCECERWLPTQWPSAECCCRCVSVNDGCQPSGHQQSVAA